MSTRPQPARIHLLPAKEAPYVVILRRKPSRMFHVIRLNTLTNFIEHGSWFRGRLFPMRCDVSFDGEWMVYFASGATSDTWNGVCRLPFLRTSLESKHHSTYHGGGYWRDCKTLVLNQWWRSIEGRVPFELESMLGSHVDSDPAVLYSRLKRDGWEPSPEPAIVQDSGWRIRPTPRHPYLRLWSLGYSAQKGGYVFRFKIDDFADLLDGHVTWACWDSLHNLIFARLGIVYKYSLSDLQCGKPGAKFDLEPLTLPKRELNPESISP